MLSVSVDPQTAPERCLIATWPCGCMGAVMSLRWTTPAQQGTFFKENAEEGALVENVTMDDYRARGGLVGCKHDPQWGGIESTHDYCDRCGKRVLKKKAGGLRAHDIFRGTRC